MITGRCHKSEGPFARDANCPPELPDTSFFYIDPDFGIELEVETDEDMRQLML